MEDINVVYGNDTNTGTISDRIARFIREKWAQIAVLAACEVGHRRQRLSLKFRDQDKGGRCNCD
jgi:hypothetical protein